MEIHTTLEVRMSTGQSSIKITAKGSLLLASLVGSLCGLASNFLGSSGLGGKDVKVNVQRMTSGQESVQQSP